MEDPVWPRPLKKAYAERMNVNPTAGLISEAWNLYQQHWRHLIPVAAIVYLAVGLISGILSAILGGFGALLASVLSLVGVFWVQGALTRAVQDVRDGKADLSVQETFQSVQDRIASIAGASFLAGIGIAIGLVLLLIPGLYLMTMWALIVPVIVVERVGALDSFGRSRALVSGHGWNAFSVIVLTFLILFFFGVLLGVILSPLQGFLGSFLSNVISGSLTAPFVAVTWTLLYYRLRTEFPPGPPAVA